MTPNSRWAAPALLAALFTCDACDATVDPAGPVFIDPEACRVVAVQSDYLATSVSLLRADGTLCVDNLLHSGSAPPGLVTAVSGDVTPPSTPHPDGLVVLLDRHPNAVLTFVEPHTAEVRGQLSVGTGFAANPHDVAFLAPDHAWVTRNETNPSPTADPADLDDGGDLLVIDPAALSLLDRIDLHPEADAGLDPRPDRVALGGGLVWVSLNHLSRLFDAGGPGLLLALDPATRGVVHRLTFPDLTNCGGLAPTTAGDGLWLVCTGLFADAPAEQLARSGLVYIDLSGAAPTVTLALSAADLADRPLGAGVTAVAGGAVALVVALGSLDPARADRLYAVDRATGAATDTGVSAGGFQLGAPLLSPDADLVLVPVADPIEPRVRRYAWTGTGLGDELEAVAPSPSVGLAPRHLAVFR